MIFAVQVIDKLFEALSGIVQDHHNKSMAKVKWGFKEIFLAIQKFFYNLLPYSYLIFLFKT